MLHANKSPTVKVVLFERTDVQDQLLPHTCHLEEALHNYTCWFLCINN